MIKEKIRHLYSNEILTRKDFIIEATSDYDLQENGGSHSDFYLENNELFTEYFLKTTDYDILEKYGYAVEFKVEAEMCYDNDDENYKLDLHFDIDDDDDDEKEEVDRYIPLSKSLFEENLNFHKEKGRAHYFTNQIKNTDLVNCVDFGVKLNDDDYCNKIIYNVFTIDDDDNVNYYVANNKTYIGEAESLDEIKELILEDFEDRDINPKYINTLNDFLKENFKIKENEINQESKNKMVSESKNKMSYRP